MAAAGPVNMDVDATSGDASASQTSNIVNSGHSQRAQAPVAVGAGSPTTATRSRAKAQRPSARTKSPTKFRMVTRGRARLKEAPQTSASVPMDVTTTLNVTTPMNNINKRPSPTMASHASIKKAKKDAYESAAGKIQRAYRHMLAAREALEQEQRKWEARQAKRDRRRVREEKRSKQKAGFAQGSSLVQHHSKAAYSPSDSSKDNVHLGVDLDEYTDETFGSDYTEEDVTSDDVDDKKPAAK
jgi:hypothetical protein